MVEGWWLDPQLSLSRELELETARRAIPRMHRHDLEARLDSALVHTVTMDHLLRQALARVQELELREIINQPPTPLKVSIMRRLMGSESKARG
jgi:hypothetical protein